MIKQLLKHGTDYLAESSNSPRLDSEVLMQFVLGVSKTFLVTEGSKEVDDSLKHQFFNLLERRKSGVPVAYLTGKKEFYGRDFLVTEHVLIPRPETEILVEEALKLLSPGKRVLEIGVGSGCVILTLCLECPRIIATGSDISDEALKVATQNKISLGVENLELINSNLFSNIKGKFDLIVSNPPYVPEGMGDLSIRFEPALALYGGGEGLDLINQLVKVAPAFLNPGGHLIFECGKGQADRFHGAQTFKDLQGIERIVKFSF